MDINGKISLLKDEYLLLQNFYEDFDRRALVIKGWSVTISIGGLALGFDREKPMIWLLAVIAGALFWFIDAKWKTYQYANRKRIEEIESYFLEGEKQQAIAPLQMYAKWWVGYGEQSVLKCAFMPIVMLPHVAAIAAGGIFLLVHYKWYPLVAGS